MLMNNLIDAITKRRSIRKYTTRRVNKETCDEVLEAATWAPSAHNAQPWRFTVIMEASTKEALAGAMGKAWIEDINNNTPHKLAQKLVKRSIERFTTAPVVVVACVTMAELPKPNGDDRREIERDLALQGLGAAIENLLLAAHSKGLGACWYCAPIFCKNIVKEILRLPTSFEPQALVTIGYPSKIPRTPKRKPSRDIFRIGYWNEKSN
jgi:coenzyme F420-0:L-glutamate ligase/coenzyme F420-1:gamma-L-glutamate ligase